MGGAAWAPIRKVVAAALTALIASGGLLALLAGTGDVGWREIVGTLVGAALPVIVAYLTPPDAKQATQAVAKLPQPVLLAQANERLEAGDATPVREPFRASEGESPY